MDIAVRHSLPFDEIPLFARLPKHRRDALERHIRICHFDAGERIFEEGEQNPGRFFIVLEGEVSLCNRGQAFSTHTMADYEIAVRRKSDVFGAISFLDGKPFSSSAFAKTPLTLAVLCFSEAGSSAELRKLRAAVVAELRRQLTADLRLSIADRLGSLQQEAEFARYKNAVGRIVVTTLAILSFYTLPIRCS